MPRVSTDTSTAEIIGAFPKDTIARSEIVELETGLSKAKTDPDTGNEYGNSPMAVLTWRIADGPFAGRTVPFHYVMLGGTTKKGTPMPVTGLLELIDAVKAPWATSPSEPLVARPFKRVKNDKGYTVFINPDTGQQITNIDYNMPEDFLGKFAMVRYGVRKGQNGRDFNEVVEVKPLP